MNKKNASKRLETILKETKELELLLANYPDISNVDNLICLIENCNEKVYTEGRNAVQYYNSIPGIIENNKRELKEIACYYQKSGDVVQLSKCKDILDDTLINDYINKKKLQKKVILIIAAVCITIMIIFGYKCYRYYEGVRLLETEKYDEAIQRLNQSGILDSGFKISEALYREGLALEAEEQYAEAVENFRAAGIFDSNDKIAEALYKEGRQLESKGEYSNAINKYTESNIYDSADRVERLYKIVFAEFKKTGLCSSIAAGGWHVAALLNDGTVKSAGLDTLNRRNTAEWKNIVSIAASNFGTIGLTTDGKAVSTGQLNYSILESENEGHDAILDTGEWNGLVAVAMSEHNAFGLKTDGTVEICGADRNNVLNEVRSWENVKQISACGGMICALKDDGSVVATSYFEGLEVPSEINQMSNVTMVAASRHGCAGLKESGSVVTAGYYSSYDCSKEISDWRNIVKIIGVDDISGDNQLIGLTCDGHVEYSGEYCGDYYDVLSSWTDIVDIAASEFSVIGLKKDGTVCSTFFSGRDGEQEINEWKNIAICR